MPRSSFASWCRPEGDRWLGIVFQVSVRNGALPGRPAQFTLQFQLSEEPAPFTGWQLRLSSLLAEDERSDLTVIQNAVMAKVHYPGDEAFGIDDPAILRWLRAEFEPITVPYTERDDIWFRQTDEEDVAAWTAWLGTIIPSAIDRFLHVVAADESRAR
jgi:hypothetical protein